MKPLNGEKTHPLTAHAIAALVALSRGPKPRREVNPGLANRLLRGALVESVFLPSPYKNQATVKIEYLRLTKAGHDTALASQKPSVPKVEESP
jgi:hypothetical protein